MVRYFLNQIIRGYGEVLTNRLKDNNQLLPAGYPDVLKLLFDRELDLDWSGGAGSNASLALTTAVQFSRFSLVKILLEEIYRSRSTPIVLAVIQEDVDMFPLLRHYGAESGTLETRGQAMAEAVSYGLELMVDVLVRKGVERGAVRQAQRPRSFLLSNSVSRARC